MTVKPNGGQTFSFSFDAPDPWPLVPALPPHSFRLLKINAVKKHHKISHAEPQSIDNAKFYRNWPKMAEK